MAGGRQGGPAGAAQVVHAPRLAVHRRPAAQTGRVFRKGQTHQQRDGQTRTRKSFRRLRFRDRQRTDPESRRDYGRQTLAARGFRTRAANPITVSARPPIVKLFRILYDIFYSCRARLSIECFVRSARVDCRLKKKTLQFNNLKLSKSFFPSARSPTQSFRARSDSVKISYKFPRNQRKMIVFSYI